MESKTLDTARYYLSQSLCIERREQLSTVLNAAGATSVSLDDPSMTHFITNVPPADDALESLPGDCTAALVTPTWIERSLILGSPQPPEFYSPDPAMLFSGVVATACDLSSRDEEILSAAIVSLGGQWRTALTKDVTHLFAVAPGSMKYETAMAYREQTGMLILVPHWFDDSVRLGIKGLPTAEYEWPEPAVFQGNADKEEAKDIESMRPYRMSDEKKAYFETAFAGGSDLPYARDHPRDLWKGQRILLSASLALSESQRDAHEEDIRRWGGRVVELRTLKGGGSHEAIVQEETEKVDEADVLVTRYRSGSAFVKAYKAGKTIGTLSWLWYVRASGTLARPIDHLLHYPIPKRPLSGFQSHIITITNYTGPHREYLKKLIVTMGGEFTPSMSGKNTVLIAAYIHGTKTEKAISWSIPTVNHTWLEDCFIQWRALTPADPKYIVFPPRVNFSQVLAERRQGGRIAFDEAELEALVREDEEPQELIPEGTNSAEDVREVEKAVSVSEHASSYTDYDVEMAAADEEPAVPRGRPTKPRSRRRASSVQPQYEGPVTRSRSRSRMRSVSGPREEEPPQRVTRSRSRSRARSTSVRRSAAAEKSELAKDTPKTRGRKKQLRKEPDNEPMEMDEEARVQKKPTRAKAQASARKSTKKSAPSEDERTENEDSDAPPPLPVRSAKRAGASHSRDPAQRTDKDAAEHSPAKGARTAKRRLSVLVPTVAQAYSSPSRPAPSSPKKTADRIESVRAEAAEAATRTPEKRARPSAAVTKRGKADADASPVRPVRQAAASGSGPPVGGPSRAESETPSLRTASKRSAANKATQRLHDVVMPDMVNYEKQKKRGVVRGAWEGEQGSAKGKGKEVAVEESPTKPGKADKAKGRKRQSITKGEEAQSSDEQPDKKRQRTAAARADRRKSGAQNDAESVGAEPATAPKGRRKSGPKGKEDLGDSTSSTRSNAKGVKIMTTQITVSDEVTKVLTKLGAKITTNPSECTHLVTKGLVRTEKFLCAMAVAPFIVNEKWLLSSAAAKQLLPEDGYALVDPDNEKKYGFKLADALQRAKKNGGKLFSGMTFYVTPRVPVETKLLKNVVTACGGTVSTQTPTVRILNGHNDRYVISSPSDVSTWRPLAQQGHAIYSQELILTAALKQQIDWDNSAYRVEGSS